jgi:glutathione S-transferase
VIRLYDWGPSPFCRKVRTVLNYKSVAYDKLHVLGPRIFEVKRRGRVGKVPALEIDGQIFVDSTDICLELERRFPSPPIVPADAKLAATCHLIEDWSDESLYFIGLHFQWLDEEGAPMVARAFARSLFGRVAHRFYRRRIRAQVVGHGTGRKPAAMIEADLRRDLATIERLAEPGPFLLGEHPFLCDFAVMSMLVYFSHAPKSGRILAEHGGIAAYMQRMRGAVSGFELQSSRDRHGMKP